MSLFGTHVSQLQVPFLRYVNNPSHLQKFCVGLLHGIHKWQAGNSKEQNGSYKVEWEMEKVALVLYRTRIGLPIFLEYLDCVPIPNQIWPKLFGRKVSNQKTIRDREWLPCNRALLTNVDILKTKTILLRHHHHLTLNHHSTISSFTPYCPTPLSK